MRHQLAQKKAESRTPKDGEQSQKQEFAETEQKDPFLTVQPDIMRWGYLYLIYNILGKAEQSEEASEAKAICNALYIYVAFFFRLALELPFSPSLKMDKERKERWV